MKKILQTLIATIAIFSLSFSLTFAAPTPAKFFTTAFDASVGQTIEFELKVDGSSANPVYTVIANLEYNKDLLRFKGASYQPNWIPVAPDEVTDPVNGVIKRTAGYPSGLQTTGSFVKYSFEAKAPGKATVNIIGSSAYDAENNDLGLQNKSITVNIGGTEVAEVAKTEEVKKEEKKVTQVITLSFVGDTGMSRDEAFNFAIEHKLKVNQETEGTTTVAIFDINGQEVLKQEKAYLTNSDQSIAFTIPENTLVAGNYSIVIDTKHDNQKNSSRITKDLGVVEPKEKIITNINEIPVIPMYIWGIIAFLVLMIILFITYNKSKRFRKFLKNF